VGIARLRLHDSLGRVLRLRGRSWWALRPSGAVRAPSCLERALLRPKAGLGRRCFSSTARHRRFHVLHRPLLECTLPVPAAPASPFRSVPSSRQTPPR